MHHAIEKAATASLENHRHIGLGHAVVEALNPFSIAAPNDLANQWSHGVSVGDDNETCGKERVDVVDVLVVEIGCVQQRPGSPIQLVEFRSGRFDEFA